MIANNLTFLKDGATLEIDKLPDGLLILINSRINEDSKLLKEYKQNESLGKIADLTILFATDTEISTTSNNIILDKQGSIHSICPPLANMKDFCESIMYFKKTGSDLKHLYTKIKPEKTENWIASISQFYENYNNPNSTDGLWKFGQIVPSSGEYLCSDCGYIMTLEEGSIFPSCEVCLSGEPGGASETDQEFWKKL